MKKLFTFVFLVVAIVSFGGITRPVHADTTLTPAQAAALQTQLDGLKASLAKLQAQAASPSVPVQPQPSVLATEDAAALRSALSSLAAVLGNLQTRFAADPELATRNAPVVFSALQGMAKTLTVIGTAIGGANASPVAVAQPAAPGKAFAQATPAPVAAPVPTAPAALAPPATPATSSSWRAPTSPSISMTRA